MLSQNIVQCGLQSGGRVEITPVVEEEPLCQMGVGVGGCWSCN